MESVTQSLRGFSRQLLDHRLGSGNEPLWLHEWRQSAWHIFEETPWPNSRTDEEWRRTNVMGTIRFERYSAVATHVSTLPSSAPFVFRSVLGATDAPVLLTLNGQVTEQRRLAGDIPVCFSLAEAAWEQPELVQRYLGQAAAPPSFSKFAAMNAAFWQGGAFVHIPRFAEVSEPVHVLHWIEGTEQASLPRTLIVVEDGAEATVIEGLASPDDDDVLAQPVTEIYLGRGARLRYVNVQQLGRPSYNVAIQRAVLGANSRLLSVTVTLGSRWHKSNVEMVLDGEGAETEMLGVTFADGNQFIDHHTFQDHVKPGAKSDLLFKSALNDRARTVWTGMIRVHPNAQRTDAYQANRNLLLSGNARADSIPGLEIGANEVRCTHGATAGPVDEEQIFYMMARGLDRTAAVRLLVDGFFEPVLQRIPLAELRGEVASIISQRVEGAQIRTAEKAHVR
ncbi:MAG: Fe-S cluster assembly protein SufD [Chloroflexi bacterium]|nr:Fe-S cluster assembly protein SufD [Chloroflexota bacterium]